MVVGFFDINYTNIQKVPLFAEIIYYLVGSKYITI